MHAACPTTAAASLTRLALPIRARPSCRSPCGGCRPPSSGGASTCLACLKAPSCRPPSMTRPSPRCSGAESSAGKRGGGGGGPCMHRQVCRHAHLQPPLERAEVGQPAEVPPLRVPPPDISSNRLLLLLCSFSCEKNYWNFNRHEDVGGCLARPCLPSATLYLAAPPPPAPSPRPFHSSLLLTTSSLRRPLYHDCLPPHQQQDPAANQRTRQNSAHGPCCRIQRWLTARYWPAALRCAALQAWPATPMSPPSTSWVSRTSTLGWAAVLLLDWQGVTARQGCPAWLVSCNWRLLAFVAALLDMGSLPLRCAAVEGAHNLRPAHHPAAHTCPGWRCRCTTPLPPPWPPHCQITRPSTDMHSRPWWNEASSTAL
jgi:hypothetical protein